MLSKLQIGYICVCPASLGHAKICSAVKKRSTDDMATLTLRYVAAVKSYYHPTLQLPSRILASFSSLFLWPATLALFSVVLFCCFQHSCKPRVHYLASAKQQADKVRN